MWLALVIAAVVLFIACAVYVEFGRRGRREIELTTDKSTYYQVMAGHSTSVYGVS
jgi:hypothetical protein